MDETAVPVSLACTYRLRVDANDTLVNDRHFERSSLPMLSSIRIHISWSRHLEIYEYSRYFAPNATLLISNLCPQNPNIYQTSLQHHNFLPILPFSGSLAISSTSSTAAPVSATSPTTASASSLFSRSLPK